MTEDDKQHLAHELRITRCRSCNARIVWFKTPAGHNMPINAETVSPQDTAYDRSKHKSHFATCPNAHVHRKPR